MLRVMKVSAASTTSSPRSTIAVPRKFSSSPRSPSRSLLQPTGSFTHCLIGLFHSLPADPPRASVIDSAIDDNTPVANSIGSKINTASRLKKSCTVAAANARLNSSDCRIEPSDTRVFVTVVPMLAPMIIGTAASTPSAPEATSPTTTDVLAEED